MPENGQQYISVQDAAIRAAVSVDTIRRAIATGELPAYRVGRARTRDGRALGRLRIRMTDFDAMFRPVPAAGRAGGDAA